MIDNDVSTPHDDWDDLGDMKDFETAPDPEMDTLMDIVNKLHAAGLKVEKKGLENVKGPRIKPVSLGKGEGFKMIKKWENIYRRDDSVGMWAIIYPVGNHRNDSESDWRNYLESVIGAGKSSLDEMPGIQFFENYAVIITVRIPGSKRVTEGLDADDDLGDMKDMAYAPVISRRGVMFRFIFAPDENDRPVPYKDMLIPYKVFYELGIMDYYTLRDAWENDEIRMSGEDAVMLYARDKSKFVNRHWDDDLEEIKLLPPERQLMEAAEDEDDIGDMKEFDQPAYTDAEMDEMLATEVADKLRAAGLKFGDCKKLRNIRMGGLRDIVRLGKDAAFVLGNRMKVQTDGTALVSMWAVIRYSPEYCQYTDWALYINKIIGKENQVWVFNDNLVEITIPVGPSSQKFMAERLAVRIKAATPEGLKRLEGVYKEIFEQAKQMSSTLDKPVLIQEIAGCVNFWLDSKGNAFNAGSSHAEWAAKHLGIKLPNSAAEKDFWSVQGDIYRRMAKKGWLRVAILPGVSIMMDNTSRAVSGIQWDWVTAKAITGKLKIVDDQDDVIADYSVEESLNEPEDDIGDMKDFVGDDTRCIITSVSAFRQGATTYLKGGSFHYGAEHAQVFSNPQAAQRHIDALVRKGKLMPDSQTNLPLEIVPLEESVDDDIGDMKDMAGIPDGYVVKAASPVKGVHTYLGGTVFRYGKSNAQVYSEPQYAQDAIDRMVRMGTLLPDAQAKLPIVIEPLEESRVKLAVQSLLEDDLDDLDDLGDMKDFEGKPENTLEDLLVSRGFERKHRGGNMWIKEIQRPNGMVFKLTAYKNSDTHFINWVFYVMSAHKGEGEWSQVAFKTGSAEAVMIAVKRFLSITESAGDEDDLGDMKDFEGEPDPGYRVTGNKSVNDTLGIVRTLGQRGWDRLHVTRPGVEGDTWVFRFHVPEQAKGTESRVSIDHRALVTMLIGVEDHCKGDIRVWMDYDEVKDEYKAQVSRPLGESLEDDDLGDMKDFEGEAPETYVIVGQQGGDEPDLYYVGRFGSNKHRVSWTMHADKARKFSTDEQAWRASTRLRLPSYLGVYVKPYSSLSESHSTRSSDLAVKCLLEDDFDDLGDMKDMAGAPTPNFEVEGTANDKFVPGEAYKVMENGSWVDVIVGRVVWPPDQYRIQFDMLWAYRKEIADGNKSMEAWVEDKAREDVTAAVEKAFRGKVSVEIVRHTDKNWDYDFEAIIKVPKGYDMVEAVVVPDRQETDAIVDIIVFGRKSTPEELNAKLAPYHIEVKDIPAFTEFPGAAGGVYGDMFYLNPKVLPYIGRDSLKTLVGHEMVHAGQMAKVAAAGADPHKITADLEDKMRKVGMEKFYATSPFELMALAKNAYDSMKERGVDVLVMLRKGSAAAFSPMRVSRSNDRFNKYVYQYAQKDKLVESAIAQLLEDDDIGDMKDMEGEPPFDPTNLGMRPVSTPAGPSGSTWTTGLIEAPNSGYSFALCLRYSAGTQRMLENTYVITVYVAPQFNSLVRLSGLSAEFIQDNMADVVHDFRAAVAGTGEPHTVTSAVRNAVKSKSPTGNVRFTESQDDDDIGDMKDLESSPSRDVTRQPGPNHGYDYRDKTGSCLEVRAGTGGYVYFALTYRQGLTTEEDRADIGLALVRAAVGDMAKGQTIGLAKETELRGENKWLPRPPLDSDDPASLWNLAVELERSGELAPAGTSGMIAYERVLIGRGSSVRESEDDDIGDLKDLAGAPLFRFPSSGVIDFNGADYPIKVESVHQEGKSYGVWQVGIRSLYGEWHWWDLELVLSDRGEAVFAAGIPWKIGEKVCEWLSDLGYSLEFQESMDDDDIGDMKDFEGEPPKSYGTFEAWLTGHGYSYRSKGGDRWVKEHGRWRIEVRRLRVDWEMSMDLDGFEWYRDRSGNPYGVGFNRWLERLVRKDEEAFGDINESQEDDDIGDMKDLAGEPYKPEFSFKIEKAGGPGYMIFINFGEHYVGHMWVRTMGGAKSQVAAYQKQFPIMQRTLPFEPSKFGNDVWLWTVRAVGDMNMSFAEFYAAIADGTLTEGMDDDDIGDMKDMETEPPRIFYRFTIDKDEEANRFIDVEIPWSAFEQFGVTNPADRSLLYTNDNKALMDECARIYATTYCPELDDDWPWISDYEMIPQEEAKDALPVRESMDDDIGDMKDLEGKAPLEDWQFKLSIPRDNPRSRLIKYVYKGKYAGGGFSNAGDSEASEKEALEEIEHYKKDFIEMEEIEPFDPSKYHNVWVWYYANLNALKAKRGIIKESIVDDEVDMKDMENDHVTGYVEEEGDSSASAEPAPKKDATFNAAHWFDIATADQIGELAMEDYHFCKVADDVAFCISHDDENLDRFFGQVKGGYLTTINKSEAEAYIQAHRPEVWERVQEMVEAHTRMFGPAEAPVAA